MTDPQKALPRRPDIFGGVYGPTPAGYIRETGNKDIKSLTTPGKTTTLTPRILPPETTVPPKNMLQKPAKPAKAKTKPAIDDYSTNYVPPVPKTQWSAPVTPETAKAPELAGIVNPDVQIKPAVANTNPDEPVICDDPLPTDRSRPDLKYQALFDHMKPGQCLRCETDQIGAIAGSLRKHFQRKGIKAKVKSMRHYPSDRMGRVWWVA